MARLSRLVLAVLVCASLAAPAFAQFPKIKIPKVSNPISNPVSTAQDVQRGPCKTPEVTASEQPELKPDQPNEVTLTVTNMELQPGEYTPKSDGTIPIGGGLSLQGSYACSKITKAVVIAPNKIKVTVIPESGKGDCYVALNAPCGGASSDFKVFDTEKARAAKEKEEAERKQREMIESHKKMTGIDKVNFGKVWLVEFVDGTKDTWTYVSDDSGGLMKIFKDSKGGKVQMTFGMGMLQVQFGQCIITGRIAANKVSGNVIQCPGMEMNDEWRATIR